MRWLLAGWLLACGCGEAPTTGELRYELQWDTSGVELDPATGRWAVEREDGVRVEIEAGFLRSYSVQLVPCVDSAEAALTRWLPTALHYDGPDDPSLQRFATPESLMPVADSAQTLALAEGEYCGLHYLVARPDPPARGNTLELRGRAGGVDFSWAVEFTHGVLVPLEAFSLRRGATVRVTRPLAQLFEGIDFASATPAQASWALLERLLETLSVDVDAPG